MSMAARTLLGVPAGRWPSLGAPALRAALDPGAPGAVAASVLLGVGTVALAWGVSHGGVARSGGRGRVVAAWGGGLALTGAAVAATAPSGALWRMGVLIAVALWSMKGVVLASVRRGDAAVIPGARWWAYLLLWPGMHPAPFLRSRPTHPAPGGGDREIDRAAVARPTRRMLSGPDGVVTRRALGWMALGSTTLLGARAGAAAQAPVGLVDLGILVGTSQILHFGLLALLAGALQRAGLRVSPLFRAPLRATSLGEFWGRRWNVAFTEMTTLAVYRPLQPVAGRTAALLAGFALSGALHALAISLPARISATGPLAYFALHGLLVCVEREAERRGWRVGGPLGWVWTMGALVLPLPWLFGHAFCMAVLYPLLGLRLW